jgi:hypothetical protein
MEGSRRGRFTGSVALRAVMARRHARARRACTWRTARRECSGTAIVEGGLSKMTSLFSWAAAGAASHAAVGDQS